MFEKKTFQCTNGFIPGFLDRWISFCLDIVIFHIPEPEYLPIPTLLLFDSIPEEQSPT